MVALTTLVSTGITNLPQVGAGIDALNDVVITSPVNGNALTYNGTNWVNSVGAGSVTIADDTTTNATRYLGFVSATSGTATTLNVSSTKLYFNPSTGTLNATLFNSLSDENLKTNITKIDNALAIINSIEGYRFTWKDSNELSLGVIAQQIENILPELVTTDTYKSVNYSGIIPVLIEAIKELTKEVRSNGR